MADAPGATPDRQHVHDHEHRPEPGPGGAGGGGGHGDLVARNRAAAAQLLPAALAEIEGRAAQPLESLPMAEFERHLTAIIHAANAALFLKAILDEGTA